MNPISVILSQDRRSSAAQAKLEDQLSQGLAELDGVEVTVVPHLYDLPPDGATAEFVRSLQGDLVILSWLYPRSAFWVLDAHRVRGQFGRTSSLGEEELDEPLTRRESADYPDRTIWCFDLRTHAGPEAYLDEIAHLTGRVWPSEMQASLSEGRNGPVHRRVEPTPPRWYPVVDFSRCTHCMECLNFCLFGVFSLTDAGAVFIEEPDACRQGCPACSRICPQGAILFPQHQDPAIAGDPKASRESLKLELSQLLDGAAPADLAAAERARAIGQKPKDELSEKEREKSGRDALDQLVDEVDGLEL